MPKYDLKTQAVGSGPYTVAKFVENSSITLKANEKYWGKNKAKTPTVVVKYLADDNAAVNALKSGDVQVLAPITENLAEPFKSDSAKYTVKAGNGTDKFVLGFNNASGSKLADKRIRQAIRYAINHKGSSPLAAVRTRRSAARSRLSTPATRIDESVPV